VYLEREVIENGSQFDKKTGNQKLYDTEIWQPLLGSLGSIGLPHSWPSHPYITYCFSLFSLVFYPEEKGSWFFQNINMFLQDYTASHLRKL
jgi:hypothetical protein